MDDAYFMRRVVSWVAHHVSHGADLAGVLAANAKRRPPFTEEMIRRAYDAGVQAVTNARLINECEPGTRLCDIPGVRFPNKKGQE